MEVNEVMIWKRYETVRTKRTFKTKQYKQNKFISQQYMQWIILKHYYGSITVREIILCVCVCVCVCVCD